MNIRALMRNRNLTITFTGLASFLINELFLWSAGGKSEGNLQYTICTLVPLRVAIPLLIILILVKLSLRNWIAMNELGLEKIQKIINDIESSRFSRLRARGYLILEKTLLFLVSWLIGSSFFLTFTQSHLN